MSIANYAMLAMLNMAALALIPLVWSIPIELGGLGMSPAWISGYGALSAVVQSFHVLSIARFGPRCVATSGFISFSMPYVLFPLENLCVRHPTSRDQRRQTGDCLAPHRSTALVTLDF